MAGRGRGRGRGATMSFSIESLGFGRGESLPTSTIEPRPIFPTLEYKPVPLEENDEQNYLLALKQELRASLKDSAFFIKPAEKRKEVERYSDKYQQNGGEGNSLNIDWSRFPTELKIKPKRKCKGKSRVKPRALKPKISATDGNIDKHLEDLEKKEEIEQSEDEEEEEEKKKKEGEDDEENIEGGEVEEEELEDDTDYNMTYFDNGENYAADEDDDLDEDATY